MRDTAWQALINRGALATALMLAASTGCMGEDPCKGADGPTDPTLEIHVDEALSSGTVTTSGACTQPTCDHRGDAGGCVVWDGKMLAGNGEACVVAVQTPKGTDWQRPNGDVYRASVYSEQGCGGISGARVYFAADGGTAVSVSSQRAMPQRSSRPR